MTDTTLGRSVLATDELLRSPRLAEQLRALVPTGQLDQLDAAARQVRDGIAVAAAQGLTAGVAALPPDQHPDWTRLGALAALVTWVAGQGSTCLHSPHPARPQPIVAAAWRPDLMVCAHCTHLLQLPRNGDSDRRCDSCGRVCDVEAGDLIYPAALVLGPMQYLLGACTECHYWPDPSQEGTPS